MCSVWRSAKPPLRTVENTPSEPRTSLGSVLQQPPSSFTVSVCLTRTSDACERIQARTCTCERYQISRVPVFCIFAALVEEATKMMIIEEHRASTQAAASMQKSLHMGAAAVQFGSLSSVHSAAATEYLFESSSATSMSATMAESVISLSSKSHSVELSGHVEALSSGGLLVQGAKRGETHELNLVASRRPSAHTAARRRSEVKESFVQFKLP